MSLLACCPDVNVLHMGGRGCPPCGVPQFLGPQFWGMGFSCWGACILSLPLSELGCGRLMSVAPPAADAGTVHGGQSRALLQGRVSAVADRGTCSGLHLGTECPIRHGEGAVLTME